MELNKNLLDELSNNYNQDKTNRVMENVLNTNPLKKSINVGSAKYDTAFKFSTDLKTLKVTDQMRSGRCWIFAGMNVIRESIAKKYNLDDFELSQDYISFYDKLEKANYFMDSILEMGDKSWDDAYLSWFLREGYSEGGTGTMLQNLVAKYGVMPKDVVLETYQALHSDDMIDLLYTNLRKFSMEVQGKSYDEKQTLKWNYLSKIYNLLRMCYGTFPETFDFEYVDKDNNYHKIEGLTAKKFYEEYSGINLNDYVLILNAPSKNKPLYKLYQVKYCNNMSGKEETKYLNIDIDTFKKAIKDQLDGGEPVWFGCDCVPYMTREEGTWNSHSLDYMTPFGMDIKFDKAQMIDFRASAPNHAMVFTGYNASPERFKIENSWGEKATDNKGYYVGEKDWFDLYVYMALVNRKYLNEETLNVLNDNPIMLDPWDPIGTLAK